MCCDQQSEAEYREMLALFRLRMIVLNAAILIYVAARVLL